jgi:hypothetical protein
MIFVVSFVRDAKLLRSMCRNILITIVSFSIASAFCQLEGDHNWRQFAVTDALLFALFVSWLIMGQFWSREWQDDLDVPSGNLVFTCTQNILFYPLHFIGIRNAYSHLRNFECGHFLLTKNDLYLPFTLNLALSTCTLLLTVGWYFRKKLPQGLFRVRRIYSHTIISAWVATLVSAIVFIELSLVTRAHSDDNQGGVPLPRSHWTFSQAMAMAILISPIWEIGKYYVERNSIKIPWYLGGPSPPCICGGVGGTRDGSLESSEALEKQKEDRRKVGFWGNPCDEEHLD